ncbi:MerR family transcriptional regulator [Metabacillus litoralis]|jgi:MerR family transcriptional regulator, aldehyde-responsive regulator|uniref:MerR family transcriptional regulator n=1 Tax=Metabacillus litoralis TaxID=152268 RepID=UPI00203B5847|nr:MerR family transcriptional regulator [Metabacillus litoralis]MCM3653641.1 MerR family transcriptional regulator [Metabacillus litoralis]
MMISEVSEKFGISPDTLRYYERIGLIPTINRNKSGIREYTEQDCRWIQVILFMRDAGMSIELLLEYVEMVHQGDKTMQSRKELLIKQRNQLVERINEQQKILELLNGKIESYEQSVVPNEKKLMGTED